jgi:DNA-directed RNA polymerase subunit N (RpoN/RPB10)
MDLARRIVLGIVCLALLGLLAAWLSAEEPLRCFVCGKKIKGAYIEYEGKIVCSQSCLGALLPKCATCGKPVSTGKGLKGEYLKYNGKYYCSQECFEEALPKCAVCGKPVKGGFKDQEGKLYCSQECYRQSLPRCEICSRPMEAWSEIEGHKYCKACAELPRCLGCQLPGAEEKLDDGRHICKKCLETAVVAPGEAQRLFDQVRHDMAEKLKLSTGHKIAFRLVDARELSKIVGHQAVHENGFFHYKGTIDQASGRTLSAEYRIYVLSHLSSERFRDVAAHELAHDLNQALYPRVAGSRCKQAVEGFAQYLSAVMNKHWGQDGLNADKLNNVDPDYVAGFQKFLELDRQGGIKAALGFMDSLNQAGKAKRTRSGK